MSLSFDGGTVDAAWLFRAPCDPEDLIRLGPTGFQCYVRLLFVPDPASSGVAEADVEVVDGRPSDGRLVERTVQVLGRGSREPLVFCLWEGYSDMPVPEVPMLRVGGVRRYVVARGSLDDLDRWSASVGLSESRPPAFTWPEDRSWCVTSDVDPHWAVVGCDATGRDLLLASDLPIAPMRRTDDPPRFES